MRLVDVRELARTGRLYPSLILHGADASRRREAAIDLARTLLCESPAVDRPCGICRHCQRIVLPGGRDDPFHPDFHLLERDRRTVTSVEATKELVQSAQLSPFEARGQVFVVAEADTLSGGAANALLKTLEEPHESAPRNFLLLAPSQFDLLPTLRSRSLSVYLGAAAELDRQRVDEIAAALSRSLAAYAESRSPAYLMTVADRLLAAGGWEDPRAAEPWALAAAAVTRAARAGDLEREDRYRLLTLAVELLDSPQWRSRGVPAKRILEGLVSKHLA